MRHNMAHVDATDMPEERHCDKRSLRQIGGPQRGGDHLNRTAKVDVVEWKSKFGAKSSDTCREVITILSHFSAPGFNRIVLSGEQ